MEQLILQRFGTGGYYDASLWGSATIVLTSSYIGTPGQCFASTGARFYNKVFAIADGRINSLCHFCLTLTRAKATDDTCQRAVSREIARNIVAGKQGFSGRVEQVFNSQRHTARGHPAQTDQACATKMGGISAHVNFFTIIPLHKSTVGAFIDDDVTRLVQFNACMHAGYKITFYGDIIVVSAAKRNAALFFRIKHNCTVLSVVMICPALAWDVLRLAIFTATPKMSFFSTAT